MVLKDITGKIGRFVSGRIAAFRDKGSHGSILSSCLYPYSPKSREEGNPDDSPPPLVIFYSGDGGWAKLTSSVSRELQTAGYPVVGIDCMHYFWREKDPDEAAGELAKLIKDKSAQWNTSGVILLGYSMGADVLPLICRHVSKETIDQVNCMILICPSHRVQLKFRFIGWLGFETPENAGFPLLPDVGILTDFFPISCISGEKEKDCFASKLPEEIAHTQTLPGGHHFGGDYQTLAKCLLAEISRDAAL